MALTAQAPRTGVFPRRQGERPLHQRKERGNPRKVVSARLGSALQTFVEDAEASGMTATGVVLRALEVAKDITEAMGAEWWELEKIASVEKSSPGKVLAQLALEILKRRKK